MDLTKHATLREWLTVALAELGGSATKQQALAYMEEWFGDLLTEDDHGTQPSNGEVKWRNRTAFERQRMKVDDLIQSGGPHNLWTLTQQGWSEYQKLIGEVPDDDPLRDFKPKSSAEYRARLIGRVQIRTRDHEALIAEFGPYVARRGFTPRTSVHPRDLTLVKGSTEWLVEVKVVRNGAAVRSGREAIAQLLDYRHFIYEGVPAPRMVGVFSEGLGAAYTAFLESLGIAVVWRANGEWHGSRLAKEDDLVD